MSTSDLQGQRILLIDGHAMAFRAFFALPADGFSDGRGQATNAVYGFTRMIFNVVAAEEPTHLVVAFDLSGGTFRDRIYDQYKGGRDETPPELVGQFALIKQVLDALGVTWLTVPDFEADDIIATLATRAGREGGTALVVTSDRDALQLVDEHVTLLQPVKGVTEMRRMDPAAVEEKYQVTPAQYPDLAALVGEAADNLPGVPGVGPKTAAKWIGLYGGLEGVLSHAEEITGKAGQSLRDHLDEVRRNRLMNAAVLDLDLPVDAAEFTLGRGSRAAVTEAFDQLAFGATIRRDLPAVFLADDEDVPVDPRTLRDPDEELRTESDLRALASGPAGVLALDAGTDIRGGMLVGIAAPGYRGAWAVDQLDEGTRQALQRCIDRASKVLVADVHLQRSRLETVGLEIGERVRDLALEAFVLQPGSRSYEAETLAQSFLGEQFEARPRKPSQTALAKESAEDRQQHIDVAARRLARSAALLGDVQEALAPRLAEEPWAVRLLDDLEVPLQEVLESLHVRGIGIDADRVRDLIGEFEGYVSQARREAGAIVGEEVNLASPKQLQTVLFENLELPHTRKVASGYSTDAEALADLQEGLDPAGSGHEFLSWLLRFREMSKLLGYLVGLDKAVEKDSRVRTTFQQTAAATGRLASTEPNLQNIPVRTAEGRRIREVFVPSEGFDALMTADYSQIEMRIMAHLSKDEGLIEAFRSGEDLHRFVASRVFSVDPDDVDGAMRSKTKAVSYGLAYGLSAFGLGRQLRISQGEATALRDGYFERFGGVRDFLRSSVETARDTGYTETILGRRRYLPDLTSDNRQRRENAERVALNSPIQGSAADIIKLAMLAVEDGLREEGLTSRVLLQVHDELVLEIASGERDAVEAVVRSGMEGAYELSVPLDVGIGVGSSWLDAAH